MTSSYNAGKPSLMIKIQEHISSSIQESEDIQNDIYIQQMSQIKAPTAFIEYLRISELFSEKNKKGQESFAQDINLPLMHLKYGYCNPLGFLIYFNKYQDIRVAFYPYKDKEDDKRIRFSLKSPIFLNGSDLQGMQRAQAANLVQGLDATLKVFILDAFQRDNLPITCQDDAFGTHPNQAPQLILAYNQGLIQIAQYYQSYFDGFNRWLPQYANDQLQDLQTKLLKTKKYQLSQRKDLETAILLYDDLKTVPCLYKLHLFKPQGVTISSFQRRLF